MAEDMVCPGTGIALIHPFCVPLESIDHEFVEQRFGFAALLASESTTMIPGVSSK
jgi:hypothetical protein